MNNHVEDAQENTKQTDQQQVEIPLWVEMAFSLTKKRIHAIYLVLANAICGLYFIPWKTFFPENPLVAKLFFVDHWEYVLIIAVILVWYGVCFKWMDKHKAWLQD